MKRKSKLLILILAIPLSCSLQSCGQKDVASEDTHGSSGQVRNKPAATVSHYAAARFADQVSFGATPALVAEIEQKGFVQWIDDQFALPVSKIDASPAKVYDDQDRIKTNAVIIYTTDQLYIAMLASPDQLRHRVSWAMSQFVTISLGKVQQYGTMLYANFLQDHAFGNYGSFIRALSVNPPMGVYLDNIQNRPTSSECLGCAPNENYARELMQLFTLGVIKLNADGSTVRDAQNKPVETYTQEDVEQLAAALTGWSMATAPKFDYGRFDGVLLREPWTAAHDRKAKKILGTTLPAGNEADVELDSVVTILMAHQNIAPFISLRLIQHLVTSDPTPAYIARISAVFRNNGKGVVGDMKAVVKAILLDAEARAGDQIGAGTTRFGKMREPILWYTAFLRGLGCTKPLHFREGGVFVPLSQRAFEPISVFSFYAPTDRAPGSNLLAPEQKLLNAPEFSSRIGGYDWTVPSNAIDCPLDEIGRAYSESPQAILNLISERYFRGAMPPTLRQTLIELAPTIYGTDPNHKAKTLLTYALTTPYFGVIR